MPHDSYTSVHCAQNLEFTIYQDETSYKESQISKAWYDGKKLHIDFKEIDEVDLVGFKSILMEAIERGRI